MNIDLSKHEIKALINGLLWSEGVLIWEWM